jgi:glycerol-3-phosphate acyltransferase PlsY
LGSNLKSSGSKNIGATNAFRILGPWWGGAVFLLDTVKGLVASFTPVLTAPAGSISAGGFGIGPTLVPAALVAGLAAILGHMFSPFAGFKGGRGVATSLGVFLGVATYPTLLVLGVWSVLFAATRRVSVGSIGAAAAYPLLLRWLAPAGPFRDWILFVGIAVAALVIVRHLPNIRRLIRGEEPALFGKGSTRPEESKP